MPNFLQQIFSLILIVIFSPILLIVSIIIFIDDGFPIIFSQKRVGLNGKIFHCFKYRSMLRDSEEILQNDKRLMSIYLDNDYKIPENLETRYTKYGLFLRQSSLDELPQLFNVLFGQMNLVGPRPVVLDELDHYKDDKKKLFLSVKPGMTGLWQVSGRSNIDYPERVDFELSYVKERSFLNDVKILFQTLAVVIAKKGAH